MYVWNEKKRYTSPKCRIVLVLYVQNSIDCFNLKQANTIATKQNTPIASSTLPALKTKSKEQNFTDMDEFLNVLVPTEETARLWGPDPNHFIRSNLMDSFANELVSEQQVREAMNEEQNVRSEEKLRNVINDVLSNFLERGMNFIYSDRAVHILRDFASANTAVNVFNYSLMFMASQHE